MQALEVMNILILHIVMFYFPFLCLNLKFLKMRKDVDTCLVAIDLKITLYILKIHFIFDLVIKFKLNFCIINLNSKDLIQQREKGNM